MEKIKVKINPGSYDVVVGSRLMDRLEFHVSKLAPTQVFILSDERLSGPRKKLSSRLKKLGCRVEGMSIKASESAKDLRKVFPIYTRLIEKKMDRGAVIFALGGGVIGDIAGFVAATYLRGIRWVGVPTTLLAQVDSSIGGKTGVNHPLGKNLIGSFHQPSLVLCDTDLLKTLSRRDRVSGFGEMIKYGMAFDAGYYNRLERDHARILDLDPEVLAPAVAASIRWKAKIVARDPLETSGVRRTLNLGHTLGHAFEAATGFRRYRHGEAVILGLRAAAALSVERGHLREGVQVAIEGFLKSLPVPKAPKIPLSSLLKYTKRDKKVVDGKPVYVLLKSLGKTVCDSGVTDAKVRAALARMGMA